MSNDKSKSPAAKTAAPTATPPAPKPVETIPGHTPPLFRRIDWFAFTLTTLLVWLGYYHTLAPNLTLEDCGELATASYYAGIPHPPGYPVWTIYTWLWTLLPVSNIAWRVALGSATAGAFGCGLLALLVSRGSSMMMEGIGGLKEISRRWEAAICIAAGFVAGMMLGFNGYMWSQSVIVEVYSLSVLSLMGVLFGLLRWTYAPHQFRYLYLAFFMYGICVNNHQSLLVIALGMEAWVLAVHPKLARDLFFWNTICYVGGLVAGELGYAGVLTGNAPVYFVFNTIGIASAAAWVWLAITTKLKAIEIKRDVVLLGVIVCAALWFGSVTSYITKFSQSDAAKIFFALLTIAGGAFYFKMIKETKSLSREWLVTLTCGGAFAVGAACYLWMAISGMTNPPMQWGYPRTVEGFFHALTRGQYEKIHPTSGTGDNAFDYIQSLISTYTRQVWLYLDGLSEEFHWVYILIALVVFMFVWRMQKRERAIVIGMGAIFITLGPFLIYLLNPPPDRQARELIRVFFTASHVLVSMGVGYGLSLIAADLATNYQSFRRAAIIGGLVAIDLAIFALAVNTHSLLGESQSDAATQQALRLAGSVHTFVRYTFIAVCIASIGLIIYRFYLAESDAKSDLPALIGLGVIGCGSLFFGLEMFNTKESGVDQSSIIGFAKIACWLFAAVCFHLTGKSNDSGDRTIPLATGGIASLISVALTIVTLRGDTAGMTGINVFFASLSKAFHPGQYALPVFANLILLGMAVVLTIAFILWRKRAPLGIVLLAFAIMPMHSVMSHWFENEQRGHMFGYWFGHDMFTPPFTGPDGKLSYDPKLRAEMMKDPAKAKLIYPEMTRDTILYGGTDPGRFCPTYTIFCESFIPPSCKKDTDPLYDRRDVYIITQNALADGTYLNYIRAHYNRSTQYKYDSPFFQELLRGPGEREQNYSTNFIASAASLLLDKPFTALGAAVEKSRREEGVYPKKEMYIATPEDSQKCFSEYLQDAQRRLQAGQLRPGEDVRVIDGRVQVSGQVAVMAINGLLTKVMFDKNPDNDFYVEESFPLDWMYPHLTPSGVIMKINRKPLPALSEEILDRDHYFWSQYSERLIGNWITYDTPVKDIVTWVEKTYLKRDLSSFKGDPKFVRDDQAQKAFSKLRSSIGGVYAWRINPQIPPEFRPRNETELRRLYKETDFVFKQAFAFCPYSPEAVFRYINLLVQPPFPIKPRFEDALAIAETCKKLDPYNGQVIDLVNKLRGASQSAGEYEKVTANLQKLEDDVRMHPTNFQAVLNLASSYMNLGQQDRAYALLDGIVARPGVPANAVHAVIQAYMSLQQYQRLETPLQKLCELMPNEPEAWYDLAALRVSLGKPADSIPALSNCLVANSARLAKNPKAVDLVAKIRTDQQFNPIRTTPEFKKLVP